MGFGQREQRADFNEGFCKRMFYGCDSWPFIRLSNTQACNRRPLKTVTHDLEEPQGSGGVGIEQQLTVYLGKRKNCF